MVLCRKSISAVILVVPFFIFKPAGARNVEPVPNKLIVLTFDDGVKSHFTTVRPILKQYGFSATFFITLGFDFLTDKKQYMTWDEIRGLSEDGFEIGNHTSDHGAVTEKSVDALAEKIRSLNKEFKKHGIPKPVSFGYPGNAFTPKAFPVLKECGIQFARRGGMPEHPYEKGRGCAYEPGFDHPLLIPSAGDARPKWTLEDFRAAVAQARFGRIAVLQFHGVPDTAHPWVSTSPGFFKRCMAYLADNGYKAVALRDLRTYVDPAVEPQEPFDSIDDRKEAIASGLPRTNFRRPPNDRELRYWLENMALYHRFSHAEMGAAVGLSDQEIDEALERWNIDPAKPKTCWGRKKLVMLPYPGGRHPRIGFLDGMIRPQRETKVSVFAPWKDGGYVVLDLPEAIWIYQDQAQKLLYLAHKDIPTIWTERGIQLKQLEWNRRSDGTLDFTRTLPNGVSFGAAVKAAERSVHMEMWLRNGTESTLRGLFVQNCVMLSDANGFDARTDQNKLMKKPFTACRGKGKNRWIVTVWRNCHRVWTNKDCPCMHSDPQFPDCAPGETKRLFGWLSFYEGNDVASECARAERWLKGR